MQNVLLSFAMGLTAAAANVFGGLIVIRYQWQRQVLKYFVALGSGFMLATALLEMVPEGLELTGNSGLTLVLGGYLLVHFFEHTILGHFHFGEETHPEEVARPGVGYTAAFGMAIHAFFDGAAIAAGFIVSTWLGVVVFFAIFLHKIPDGFTIASVMLASGQGPRRALSASVLMGVATVVGVAAMWALSVHVGVGLLLSAGATLYVAASDLIPLVNQEPGVRMALVVFVGVVFLLVMKWLFPF